MKKIIFLFILFLIPILIHAELYDYPNSVKQTNNYITQSKYSARNKYLIMNNQKFIFESGKLSSSNSFYNGGMINYDEFCLSTGNSSCKGGSYLTISNKYWTLSGTSDSRYYVDNINRTGTQSDLDKSNVRVTEFVKPNVEVTGIGTFSNPWMFNTNYYIELHSSNKKLGHFGNSTSDVKPNLVGYAEKCSDSDNYCFLLTAITIKGYTNDPIDGCGLKFIGNVSKDGNNIKRKFEIKNIKNDISCIVKFVKKELTIKYDCNGGTGNMDDQKVLYEDPFTLKDAECKKAGYQQNGWVLPDGSTWPNKYSEIFDYDYGEKGIDSKNNLVLKANWQECPLNTYSTGAEKTCKKCPNGYYTETTGSPSVHKCRRWVSCLASTCRAHYYSCRVCHTTCWTGDGWSSSCSPMCYDGTCGSSCYYCSAGWEYY